MGRLSDGAWTSEGIVFLVSFITGFFQVHIPYADVRSDGPGSSLALMSHIHDWAGLALGFFVAAHFYLNRSWIVSITRRS